MADREVPDGVAALHALDPQPGPADLHAVYAPTERRRGRWVRLNMVASLDGATALDGRSGGLAGPADHAVFRILRSFADVILVGAATMRAERYGPPALPAALRDARLARGQPALPTIAVVTRNVAFDWDAPFFVAANPAPLLITVGAAAPRVPAQAPVSDVIVAGDDQLDVTAGLDGLTERGHHDVLVEGGPTLNAMLAAADEIDELCLTVSPRLVGGSSAGLLRGDAGPPTPLTLASVLSADDYLFVRYRRGPATAT